MNLLTNLGATNTRKVAKAIGSQMLFSTKLHHTIHKFIVPVPITPVPLPDSYTIAHFRCVASSGTYMRSLAHLIGQKLSTCGLAWHIHRTKIGTYEPTNKSWRHKY
ncbi:MAG: hypothetical protein KBC35_02175 [Candidatus Pacebacteria bacterium]|nr:hypothetical protein [Candidatus Paceibacterota bacterium]